MLYVGFLDAPFRQAKLDTLINIGVAFLVLAALSVPLFLRWARSIFMPLEQMNATIGQVEKGDLSARTGLHAARDPPRRPAAPPAPLPHPSHTPDPPPPPPHHHPTPPPNPPTPPPPP